MVTPRRSWLTFLLAYTGRQAIYSIFPILKRRSWILKCPTGSHWIHIPVGLLVWFTVGRLGWRSLSLRVRGAVERHHLELDIRRHRICDDTGNGAGAAGPVRHYSVCVCACCLGCHRIRPFRDDAFQGVRDLGHSAVGRSGLGGWYGGFVAERLDWRWVFWLVGAFGVGYGFMLGPVIRRLLPSEERTRLFSRSKRSGSANPLNLFRTPTFSLFAVSFFIFCAMLWVIYAWLPTFFVEKFAFR